MNFVINVCHLTFTSGILVLQFTHTPFIFFRFFSVILPSRFLCALFFFDLTSFLSCKLFVHMIE